ncbi:unnamed protein product [Haemonchus placei]|uniref:Uncharacterized protein n=1 Tax=Haemonchus placei TaxID=6290 RepID=A0A0N4X715_HAEPC|nr:unnamed protein product [Haemonchus placei]
MMTSARNWLVIHQAETQSVPGQEFIEKLLSRSMCIGTVRDAHCTATAMTNRTCGLRHYRPHPRQLRLRALLLEYLDNKLWESEDGILSTPPFYPMMYRSKFQFFLLRRRRSQENVAMAIKGFYVTEQPLGILGGWILFVTIALRMFSILDPL